EVVGLVGVHAHRRVAMTNQGRKAIHRETAGLAEGAPGKHRAGPLGTTDELGAAAHRLTTAPPREVREVLAGVAASPAQRAGQRRERRAGLVHAVEARLTI